MVDILLLSFFHLMQLEDSNCFVEGGGGGGG